MNSTIIESQTIAAAPLAKQSIAERPATLPVHILAVGEQHQLAGSTCWIGLARPAYEEISHLQGVVIYTRTTQIFLTREEAAEAQRLLSLLLSKDGLT